MPARPQGLDHLSYLTCSETTQDLESSQLCDRRIFIDRAQQTLSDRPDCEPDVEIDSVISRLGDDDTGCESRHGLYEDQRK